MYKRQFTPRQKAEIAAHAEHTAIVLAPNMSVGVNVMLRLLDMATRALGEGYTHLIGLLQQSYAHLATLQNTTISNQNQQILRLQRVLEELMGELTKMRVGIAEVDVRRREDAGETKVRGEHGKQFIPEAGRFGPGDIIEVEAVDGALAFERVLEGEIVD